MEHELADLETVAEEGRREIADANRLLQEALDKRDRNLLDIEVKEKEIAGSKATGIIDIRDSTNFRKLRIPTDKENKYIYRPIRQTNKLLVCYWTCADDWLERIQIWRIDADTLEPTLIRNDIRKSRELTMEGADERFVMAIKTG